MRDLLLATGLLACAFASLFAMPAQAATFEVLQFSLIDLGTEGRAKLVLDHWEYEVPEQDWPYTISEGRLCITTDKPFCLSHPEGAEPFTLLYESEGQSADAHVSHVRAHVAP